MWLCPRNETIAGEEIRHLYRGVAPLSRLAHGLFNQNGSDRIHRSLVVRTFPDPGAPGLGSLFGQRPPCRKDAGRKTDIQDCQWLQYLHSVGLLRGSFRPAEAVCTVRSILRHRDTLLQSASRQMLLMQKALTQMNLQLHNVISDIIGVSGLAIIDAILMGERKPSKLSGLCDRAHQKPAPSRGQESGRRLPP